METMVPVRIEVEFEDGFIAECSGKETQKWCKERDITFNSPTWAVKQPPQRFLATPEEKGDALHEACLQAGVDEVEVSEPDNNSVAITFKAKDGFKETVTVGGGRRLTFQHKLFQTLFESIRKAHKEYLDAGSS